MPVSLLKTKDTEAVLHFPLAGLNAVSAFAKQPNQPVDASIGWYARTSPLILNCRIFDATAGRARGGSRTGLARYIDESTSGPIQGVSTITGVGYTDPVGGDVQTSSSGRVVTGVAVSNGNVKLFAPGVPGFHIPTNGTSALIASGVVFSAANGGKLFFADGTNWKYYQPSDDTVHVWTATDGTLPVDGDDNAPRLICTWRGRTVLSGLLGDPQNWFMSAVDNPFNFNYSPTSITPTQAVAGNNSTLGLIGDVVTCLIPFTDDVLIFGGDHTIWIMQGDPMDGGRLLRISDSLGMAWGSPWCSDPDGAVYFFGSDCRIYKIDPLAARPQPIPMSLQIDPFLKKVNTGSNTISMGWNRARRGFHVFVTRTAGSYPAVHLFYQAATNAWSMDYFKNKNHNPLCCAIFDGNTTDDRVLIIGSWDGYLRYWNDDAVKDDGEDILSAVVIGPILTNTFEKIKAMDMQAILGEGSGKVRYDVFTGRTAEEALASVPTLSGTWNASASGRNFTQPVNREGFAFYLKLSATTPWAMESIRLALRSLGPVLQRGA